MEKATTEKTGAATRRKHLLAGEWVGADNHTEVINPHTDEVIAEVAEAGPKQVDRALDAAVEAFETTRKLPTWQRAEILKNIADGIEARSGELAETIVAEAGKPVDYAEGEVERAVQTFTFAAEELKSMRGDTIPIDASDRGEGKWAVTKRFPVGPISSISPFNFPLNLVAHKFAPAIATGCPIVHKPADKTPLTSMLLAEIVLEAGWPPQALSSLNIPVEHAGPLTADERIKLLSFTGSDKVGWMLKNRAGKKRVVLELGGDAAVIVEPDTPDWDETVKRIAFGGYAYSGQVCISVQRIFVQESAYDRFVEDFRREVEQNVTVGDPAEPGVMVSSLIDDKATDRIREWVAETEEMGAERLCGGHREGRLFDPMIFTGVPHDSPLGSNEAFGPLTVIHSYSDIEDAVEKTNRSRYGLQAGVYSKDVEKINYCFRELEVGAVTANEVPTFRVDHMPYGGIKDSGFGREGLRYSIEEYTEERMLLMDNS